jgi:nicotinate-nucleotide adenylyltransferase
VRLGILGGTFDPPHVGHLLVAEDAIAALQLDRLILVPANTQPLKSGRVTASAEHRMAMVRAMVEGDARFEVSPVEVERGGLSYTVDTLRHFAAKHPTDERFLLVGTDVLASFSDWKEPAHVVRLAQPVVLARAGAAMIPDVGGINFQRLETRRVDVSSTEVRDRVHRGLPINGFVTEPVASLIRKHGLYT